MLRSTFLGYQTATSALRVNQNIMDVVGQNIANINTKGYTRQRLDITSFSLDSKNLKFGTDGVIIGQGVNANGMSQYRDHFLDLRYRTESAKLGEQEIQSEALSDLELVFDEIDMEGLDAQFSDFVEQLHSLTSSPSDPVLEGVVRTSATMLTQLFNDYSKQINTIKQQQFSYLKDGAIEKVNQLLDNISKLNIQIKENNINGNPALELNDDRNMLIDELSSYLDVDVTTTTQSIGGGRTVDILSINLKKSDGTSVDIVNDGNFKEFDSTYDSNGDGVIAEDEKDVVIKLRNYDKTDDSTETPSIITDDVDKGKIGGYIKIINGKGEFAQSADLNSQSNGVQYYEKMLDTLASKFAEEMNRANSTAEDLAGGINMFNKPMFVNGNNESSDPKDITAATIKISNAWAIETGSYITNSKNTDSIGNNEGATDNILNMIALFQSGEKGTLTFDTLAGTGGTPLFEGTFQEFLSFTTTRLNLQVSDVQMSYDTFSETQYQIDYARSSMSSVDLNEEGVNLLTYSKSYNAAARLMTILDEMLDTLINRMAV